MNWERNGFYSLYTRLISIFVVRSLVGKHKQHSNIVCFLHDIDIAAHVVFVIKKENEYSYFVPISVMRYLKRRKACDLELH